MSVPVAQESTTSSLGLHTHTHTHTHAHTQPCLVALCTDKHGSRVIDGVWKNCEIGQKESLAQELLAHEDELISNFYGRIVLHNCNITHYKRKQVAWKERERGVAKRREEFRDILEDRHPEKQEAVPGSSCGLKRKRCEGEGGSIRKRKVQPLEMSTSYTTHP